MWSPVRSRNVAPPNTPEFPSADFARDMAKAISEKKKKKGRKKKLPIDIEDIG